MAESHFFSQLVALWYAYRIEILVVAGLALLVIRFFNLGEPRKPSLQEVSTAQLKSDEKRPAIRISDRRTLATPVDRTKAGGPKRITGVRKNTSPSGEVNIEVEPVILYFSLGGATAKTAEVVQERLKETAGGRILTPRIENIVEIDFDTFFVSPEESLKNRRQFYILLLPSYNIDSELNTFIDGLAETHNDFRIDTAPLRNLAGYAVYGFGDSEGWPTEQQGFCYQAKEVDKWMAKLTGGKRAYPVGMTDYREATANTRVWLEGIVEIMHTISKGQGLGEGVVGSGDAVESDEEEDEQASALESASKSLKRKRKTRPTTTDLEDLRTPQSESTEIDFTTNLNGPKEMVPESSPTYASLTKQGYTIVGSHSGVKLCRWTKSALRGRGSCYKWSFYGIASHQCMETTPSLSCSNKCVFCWRHGTNPVSTTWRWTVDPPDKIFTGVKAGHYRKIKAMRGVPGVRAERFAEALRIRHCALSLVGEPIFYPHINELLGMLHGERVSTFLVCNAQHPAQLRALTQVTQLYVSIDASNKEALKRIDRPLHRDYWERFLECMDILHERRNEQRTVFRLTLVKGFNIDEEVEGYADLVERARPGLVEVKGVTYCGTSTSAAAGLTMQNVPFYEEVCEFVEKLNAALEKRGLGYGIAAEHAHSCCILMAEKERFLKADGWHTLIDYGKFFDCLESGRNFGPQDYVGPKTQEWALWGNGGFDPRDDRVDRKGKKKEGTVTVGGGRVIEL